MCYFLNSLRVPTGDFTSGLQRPRCLLKRVMLWWVRFTLHTALGKQTELTPQTESWLIIDLSVFQMKLDWVVQNNSFLILKRFN